MAEDFCIFKVLPYSFLFAAIMAVVMFFGRIIFLKGFLLEEVALNHYAFEYFLPLGVEFIAVEYFVSFYVWGMDVAVWALLS